MSAEPLFNSRLKIERAKRHFDELNASVESFKAGNPYKVFVDSDLSRQRKTYRLHVAEEVPRSWAGTIGDIIHNLRASLDCLAAALVIANGFKSKTALASAYFPIARTADELSRFDSFFQLVSPKVSKLVHRLEPYAGGKGDALWLLHELDLLDRRGGLIPVAVTLPKINLSLLSGNLLPDLPPLPFKTHAPRPLKEGDVVARSEATDGSHVSFEVAFGRTRIVDGEPLLPKLRQLIVFTERVVELFERSIFKRP